MTYGKFVKNLEEIRPKLLDRAIKCYRLSKDDAEDLVQDTMTRAYENREQFDGKNFEGWAFRILRNTMINGTRGKNGYKKANTVHNFDEDLLDTAHYTTPNYDAMVDNKETYKYIQEAIGLISQKRRTVILLISQGKTPKEIAEILGVPAETVRSRLFRGRKNVQKLLNRN